MIIFSWVMFGISALLGAASLLCFLMFVFRDDGAWLVRARNLRRGLVSALLFWFNTFIWGRVLYTIIHW